MTLSVSGADKGMRWSNQRTTRRPRRVLVTRIKPVSKAASAIMSEPAQAPMAAEHQRVAAVLRPLMFPLSFMMTSAPKKPMPETM